jgi:hypothetical protein
MLKALLQRSRIQSISDIAKTFRNARSRSGDKNVLQVGLDVAKRSRVANRVSLIVPHLAARTISHEIALPAGYPARHVRINLSIPTLPRNRVFEFSEHVVDESGRATKTVLATASDRFAVSHDLGVSWFQIRIDGYEGHRILHAKYIGQSEYLVQAISRRSNSQEPAISVLVVNEQGCILAANKIAGAPWHGCRAVDFCNGTLMYAEYPYERGDAGGKRSESRVFRSRDRGRSWHVVRTDAGIRHYHFLQARPGVAGEWWLTSGDSPDASRIWVSRDDGDTWVDLTERFADMIELDGVRYPRSLFRLTDLAWTGNDVVWGTDDALRSTKMGVPGARMVRSACGADFAPHVIGPCRWPVRSMVDVGDFFIVLTQASNRPDATPEDRMPNVFLMPKVPVAGAPPIFHLFDVRNHSIVRTGFTYSRASRAAHEGTFFTFRGSTDAFLFGQKTLRWDVAFS